MFSIQLYYSFVEESLVISTCGGKPLGLERVIGRIPAANIHKRILLASVRTLKEKTHEKRRGKHPNELLARNLKMLPPNPLAHSHYSIRIENEFTHKGAHTTHTHSWCY